MRDLLLVIIDAKEIPQCLVAGFADVDTLFKRTRKDVCSDQDGGLAPLLAPGSSGGHTCSFFYSNQQDKEPAVCRVNVELVLRSLNQGLNSLVIGPDRP
jgi:hypothetical protein